MARTARQRGRNPRGLLLIGGLAIYFVNACHQPTASPTLTPAPTTSPTIAPIPAPAKPQTTQLAPPIDHQTGRWLYAERFEPGTTGGFVEGDFSARRNRIKIKTSAITQFAVDTRHVAIDWDKLVVIRINGQNSELKRRKDPVLHFVLNRFHQWVVEE